MNLPVQNFATLVQTQASAVASAAQQLVDTTVGSVLRALLEANASVGLWIQWLILQVLSLTRAATSSGPDLDSWVADFGMSRLPASASGGQVQFSRLTPGATQMIPVGAQVRTGTGVNDQLFSVATDSTNSAWNGTGYAIAANQTSISLPVVAAVAGSAGNVVPGAISVLATALPGIDAVTNVAPMAGGLDAEADAALRQRFSSFLDSRAKATADAVGLAVASVQQNLTYTIADRMDTSGALRAGYFTVTVDDGTGAPSATLLTNVSQAVDLVRPLGAAFGVRPPLLTLAAVVVTVAGQNTNQVAIQSAVSTFITQLPIGATLYTSKIVQVTHEADSNVQSVTQVTINGSSVDLVPAVYGLIRPSSVMVSQ